MTENIFKQWLTFCLLLALPTFEANAQQDRVKKLGDYFGAFASTG